MKPRKYDEVTDRFGWDFFWNALNNNGFEFVDIGCLSFLFCKLHRWCDH